MALQMAELKSYLSSLRTRYLRFSKASLFFSGLVFGNAVAEYSFLGFLIVLIQEKSEGVNPSYDAVVSIAQECFSAFLASFLAYTTHQHIRRPFIMILVNHAILIAGLLILLFHQSPIDGIFYLALALLSVNNSGEEYMNEFLSDQLAVSQPEQDTDDAKKKNNGIDAKKTNNGIDAKETNNGIYAKETNNGIDAWRFIAKFAGAVVGGVLISDLAIGKRAFISAILVGIGCIFCCSYSRCFEVRSGDHQGEKHELRPLLKLLLLWAPFLIYYVVDAAAATFIDEASFYIIQKSSGIIVSHLIGYVITKFCGEQNQQEQKRLRFAKIAFGMLVCFCLCIDTWHVQANGKSEGSLMFILQFILLGIMEEMVKELLGEYFCDQVPKSMHHLEFTFNSFVEGMGRLLAVVCILASRNWIDVKIEKVGKVVRVKNRHLDKYFRTLAFMSLCAFLLFLYQSKTCYWTKETEDPDNDLEKLEEGSRSRGHGRPLESQSSSPHSASVSQSTASFSDDKSISASSEAAVLPNLESAGFSANRGSWSIVKRYQRCHGFLRYVIGRMGAKGKSGEKGKSEAKGKSG